MYKNVLLTTNEIKLLHSIIDQYLYSNSAHINSPNAKNLHIINRNLIGLISHKKDTKTTNNGN
jgi:hypothetical protein